MPPISERDAFYEMHALSTEQIIDALKGYTEGTQELLPHQHRLWPMRLITAIAHDHTRLNCDRDALSSSAAMLRAAEESAGRYTDADRARFRKILEAYHAKRAEQSLST